MPFFSSRKAGVAKRDVSAESKRSHSSDQSREYGLKVLYQPTNNKASAVDIVCVHGLNGDREKTWRSENGVLWLSDLLPITLPQARVFTFGYDSKPADWGSVVSQNRIGNHARNLLHAIADYREGDCSGSRPLVFIAHSLGGLICEDMLLNSRNGNGNEPHLKSVLQSTVGIMFLGTPHSGSALAEGAIMMCKLIGMFKSTTTEILQVLSRQSEVLARIQADFHTMLRGMAQEGRPIAIKCFYEELPVPGLGLIVPQNSAILLGHPHVGIHANHMNMARFDTQEDPGFIAISSELRRWTKELNPKRSRFAELFLRSTREGRAS